jgi:hypothetical protein
MIQLAQAGENGLLWEAVGATGALLSARRRPDYALARLMLPSRVRSPARSGP